MTQVNQDIQLWIGDHKAFTVTNTDVNGAAVNLTGATIRWVLRRDALSGSALISKSTVSGITITDAPGGVFQISLVPTDTSPLAPGTYYHEASMEDAGGNISTLLTGRAILEPSAVQE